MKDWISLLEEKRCKLYRDTKSDVRSVESLLSSERLEAGTDLGSAGPYAILVLGAPSICDLFGRLSEKRESMPLLCVVPPQKSIFCCTDFGSTFSLYVQQKLKPFLDSSKEQMALQSFLGIYSSFV